MDDNNGKYIFGVVKVGDKGQIVIPRDARKKYDIKPGDALLLLGDEKGMALIKTQVFDSFVDQGMEGLQNEKALDRQSALGYSSSRSVLPCHLLL